MTLSKLLDGVTVSKMFQTLYGRMVVTHDVEVHRIQYDSRKVERKDLFVAIRGYGADGHRFVPDAVARGASVVVIEDEESLPDSFFMHAGVVKVVVPDSRVALGRLAANYYEHPGKELTLIGVTGTNGKTTVTHLIQSMLERSGRPAGLIGTIEYKIGDEVTPATHTTPESLELNALLRKMADLRCTAAVMEVSSHALSQHRTDELDFQAAVFTNLTQDHLDYHSSMDEYARAKKLLFTKLSPSAAAIVNADDPWGNFMIDETNARKITFGTGPGADVLAKNVSMSIRGSRIVISHERREVEVESPLIGRFNVSNVLAAFATGVALGIPADTIRNAIRGVAGVRGRFERCESPVGWTAVIDYAHTPDALLKALTAIREISGAGRKGRIITLFGCGGNRDRTKRPRMGAIAAEHSDLVIVTSDNPRHEDPQSIIDEVLAGIPRGTNVMHEVDRKAAITRVLSEARPDDIVLIAGKGHEDYQILGDERVHFSDREVVEEFIRSHA